MRYPVLSMVAMSVIAALATVGCDKSKDADAAQAQAAAMQMPPAVVNVMPVQFQTVPLSKELSGKVVAYQEAIVTPQVTGIIEKQLFQDGRFVKQGQPLYQINADTYANTLAGSEADLAKAQASINTAKANYNNAIASLESRQAELALARANQKRLNSLKGTDAISAQEVDVGATTVDTAEAAVRNAQAQVGVAKANIEAAQAAAQGVQQVINTNKINYARTRVVAPMSGVTGRSAVDVGALATAGQTQMVTISQLNPIYVDISQSSAELLALRQSMMQGDVNAANTAQVQLILPDGSTYPVTGQLRFEEARVDSNTGAVNLRAVFPNDNGVLLPGMAVNARLIQGVIPNAVLLPQSAVTRTAKGDATVYIVDANKKIQVRPIQTQGTYQGNWIVTDGLQQGENVVVIGGMKVKPDQQVEVKPYVPDSEGQVANAPMAARANAVTAANASSPSAQPTAPSTNPPAATGRTNASAAR